MSFSNGVYIKQKFDITEALTGYENKNKYYVYERSADGSKKGKKILKCKEKSNACSRNCLSSAQRAFNMKCLNLFDNEDLCLRMEKEYSCTLGCLNRPNMKVILIENGVERYVGKIVDNFDCFNYSFALYD